MTEPEQTSTRFQIKGIRAGAREHVDDFPTKEEAIDTARAALKDFDRVIVIDADHDVVWDSDSAEQV